MWDGDFFQMLQEIRIKMFYFVPPVYIILLLSLYPIAVPQYCSQSAFLLGWFVFILAISTAIRLILGLVERKLNNG